MSQAKFLDTIESQVAGIPCLIGVRQWEFSTPARLYGPPEDCSPAEGGCGEWAVLDRRGRPAPWLERKLTDSEISRIDEELFNYFERARYVKDEPDYCFDD